MVPPSKSVPSPETTVITSTWVSCVSTAVAFAADDEETVVAPGGDASRARLVLVEFGGLGAGGNFGRFVHGEAFGIGGEDGHGCRQGKENRQ
jgi:hypothetical protein